MDMIWRQVSQYRLETFEGYMISTARINEWSSVYIARAPRTTPLIYAGRSLEKAKAECEKHIRIRGVAMVNSREKGARVEREFAALAFELGGFQLLRALEQCRSGGHDLNGLPGWAVEVKARKERPGPGELSKMWSQTLDQAQRANMRPVLAVKVNLRGWTCYVDAADLRADWWEAGMACVALEPEDFFHMVRAIGVPNETK